MNYLAFPLVLFLLLLAGCGQSHGPAEQRVIPAQIAAEQRETHRKLAMDGAENFRDLGGYQTEDGRTVKWGLIYRSDSLAELSDEDMAFMQRMKIRQVVDLRTAFEKEQEPDRIAEGINYVDRPIDVEGTAVKDLYEKISSGDIEDLNAAKLLEDANRTFVTNYQHVYSAHLKSLLEPGNLPSVAHCTGGKDRAGFAAAITLLALGVPEQTVINDFMLTNTYTKEKIEKYMLMIKLGSFFRTDPELVRPLLGVQRSYIEAALDQIRQSYGSVDNYFREGLSIDDAEIAQLQDLLLE